MSFESDLADIVKQQFKKVGIRYDKTMNVRALTARYFEMLNRRITTIPRTVHFSKEIHDSLGTLRRKADTEQSEKAAEAWGALFLIRHLLTEGKNVNGFLSRGIGWAKGKKSVDKMLWDFGMHHLHLRKKFRDGFVERSDYLLFAVVAQGDAYFVDVRPHNLGGLEWVQQDLLKIMHSNWPELVDSKILRGVKGTVLTDKEKHELRRKNVNHAVEIGGNAIAPIGGGTMADGSSLSCKWLAMRLLHEVDQHQLCFDSKLEELRSGLEAKGIEIAARMEFELVLLDGLNPSDEVIGSLREDKCLSRDLCQMGFAVVERSTQLPIVVSLEEQL